MRNKLGHIKWLYLGKRWLRKTIRQKTENNAPVKVVLGSSRDYQEIEGWIYTDLPHFDIRDSKHWQYYFHKHHTIDNLIAEHVLEHLSEKEVETVIQLASSYLKKGGCFRVAVPDSFHASDEYVKNNAPPNYKHKSAWNVRNFTKLFEQYSFQVEPLEYYSENGEFHSSEITNKNGEVRRQYANYVGNTEDAHNYSSLIIDCYKT